jgi:hypothetical protein
MVLQSSGAISLANIQTEFGGSNPISFSEYYANANPSYTSGVSGIPNTGSAISFSQFYGKAKPVVSVNYMVAGNVAGNMNESGGSRMGIDGADDSYASIGTVGFSFLWFGVQCGTNNNIWWNTNQALTFASYSNTYSAWSPGTARGLTLGQSDRRTNWSTQFSPYTSNNHSIKRFIVTQANYYSGGGNEIQMEIRLIRGPSYQYIELRMAYWAASTGGLWNLSDGGSFYNVFSGAPPIGTGASLVIRGDLNGYNWQAFNNHYMNL